MSEATGLVGKARVVGFPLGVGIFLLPVIFVWFTLRDGYSTTARVISFGWLALLLIFVFGAPHSSGPIRDPNTGETTVQNSAPSTIYKINAEAYAKLQTGMSYADAVAVIGSPGEELSKSEMAGYETLAMSWKNFDGSNAMIMFQNDKLISKAQFGLK
jgi:hypothetical protein